MHIYIYIYAQRKISIKDRLKKKNVLLTEVSDIFFENLLYLLDTCQNQGVAKNS